MARLNAANRARQQATRSRALDIKELRAKGLTLQAIADRLDITRQRVHQLIHR